MNSKPSFVTLLLLISFGSVNAVLFTPALPAITHFFSISTDLANYTITWFLIGYAMGQLLYGPLANRFGRKPAIYMGISIQIISSLLCIIAGIIDQYWLLVVARFLLALGSGVGLKITFTIVHEGFLPQQANQKTAYLMLGFAIMPGLSVALGGFLNSYWGWYSCFYAGIAYGLLLLLLSSRLPETLAHRDLHALKPRHLLATYIEQFKNKKLVLGGVTLGLCSSVIYIFAAVAPFIAINLAGMTSFEYGLANAIPPVGLITGSLISARLSKYISLHTIARAGVYVSLVGSVIMAANFELHLGIIWSLFIPMVVIYLGLCMIMASISVVALSASSDKAHSSAVMSFLNISVATIMTFISGTFVLDSLVLPACYAFIGLAMLLTVRYLAAMSPTYDD